MEPSKAAFKVKYLYSPLWETQGCHTICFHSVLEVSCKVAATFKAAVMEVRSTDLYNAQRGEAAAENSSREPPTATLTELFVSHRDSLTSIRKTTHQVRRVGEEKIFF